jgi:hypothetical protein
MKGYLIVAAVLLAALAVVVTAVSFAPGVYSRVPSIEPDSHCRAAVRAYLDGQPKQCTVVRWHESEPLSEQRTYEVSRRCLVLKQPFEWKDYDDKLLACLEADPQHGNVFGHGSAIRAEYTRDEGLGRQTMHDITFFVQDGVVQDCYPTEAVILREN